MFKQASSSTCELAPEEETLRVAVDRRRSVTVSARCCQDGLHIIEGSGVSVDDNRDKLTPRWLLWFLVALVGFSVALAAGVWWHLLSALP